MNKYFVNYKTMLENEHIRYESRAYSERSIIAVQQSLSSSTTILVSHLQ